MNGLNRGDIIRMARHVDFRYDPDADDFKALVRFAALVAAAEREACAKVCELIAINAADTRAANCAAAIRARGNDAA